MLTNSGDDEIIICIGEGYSDRCAAKYADIVFAKDELAVYCRGEGIPFYEYTSFRQITERLEQMLALHRSNPGKSRLHKRRQAELTRQSVFIGE